MTTLYLSPITFIVQYLNNIGVIAAGAQISTYVGGTVNTPATTYTDSTGIVPNPNPLAANSAGRPASASAAPVSFWTQPGVTLKLVVTDASGNLLVGPIDNISAIDDPTNVSNSLSQQLASPVNSNSVGNGPVGNTDLVANAMKSYDVFANVRAANAPNLAAGQTLIIDVQGGTGIDDGLGGLFYWSANSTAADDGLSVLKPNTSASIGRYLRLYNLGQPTTVTKTQDQQVVSSTVLVSDAQLALPVLAAGLYLVQMRLQLLGSGGTSQGWKVQGSAAGVTQGGSGAGVVSGNGTAAAQLAFVNTAFSQSAISDTSGQNDVANVDFMVSVSANTSFTVQFAQVSSSANPTIMKAGSLLTATRVG